MSERRDPSDEYAESGERMVRREDIPQRNGCRIDYIPPFKAFTVTPEGQPYFFLRNRGFEFINKSTHWKFLAMLLRQLERAQGKRKITVLDLGGGMFSQAARDLMKMPETEGKVRLINVDPFAIPITSEDLEQEGIDPQDLTILPQWFEEITLEPASVDAVISVQALNHMLPAQVQQIFMKLCRLLYPGGEALLDGGMGGDRPYLTEMGGPAHIFSSHPLGRVALEEGVFFSELFASDRLTGANATIGVTQVMTHITKKDGLVPVRFDDLTTIRPQLIRAIERITCEGKEP